MSYVSNRERYVRSLHTALVNNIENAAMALADKIRSNIGTPGPPHSAQGEYPHSITGELADSVDYEVDPHDLSARVFASAPHAEYVEDMRPFLERTLREERPLMRKHLKAGLR